MKKLALAMMVSLISIAPAGVAFAGGYVGASFGTTSPDEEGFKDDTGYRITGGALLNPNFALEASYTSLGEFEADEDTRNAIGYLAGGYDVSDVSIEVTGVEFAAVGIAPLNDTFSLFGKIGLYMWDAEVNVDVAGYGSGSDSDDGNDPFFGVGFLVNVSQQISLKGEFNRYDAMDGDVDFLGVGLNLNF